MVTASHVPPEKYFTPLVVAITEDSWILPPCFADYEVAHKTILALIKALETTGIELLPDEDLPSYLRRMITK